VLEVISESVHWDLSKSYLGSENGHERIAAAEPSEFKKPLGWTFLYRCFVVCQKKVVKYLASIYIRIILC
jgi:hypothetical protein